MSFVGGDLPTECTLSVILEERPKLLEQLALCLDKEMRLIPNGKHLASELDINADVIRRLEKQYSDYSPTIRLFEFLSVTQPDLSIEQLEDTLLEIGRNDLFSLLTKVFGYHLSRNETEKSDRCPGFHSKKGSTKNSRRT
ncbi:uncharacterized protein LOC111340290 [Stylophora pistillata]|uniref:uncharacterized protein LOC111340290 n=1 Tax=Stylophora pistillata TaxID=50429 RepID=UPI000C04BB52|nr:uncharacterized protein LOC111340290 [Stylophora pistillata]